MEISNAAKSGDGTVANVGLKVTGSFQCPDCRQKFDTMKAKQLHWKFNHSSGRDGEEVAAERAEATEELECAICFDAVAACATLPCNCRVPYCSRCWDRALAHSFQDCGQARCPSCRGPVRVDFDADAAGGRGQLVFSRETQDYDSVMRRDGRQAAAKAHHQTVERLAEQAAPVQIRLLQRFGAAHLLREIAQEPERFLNAMCSVGELERVLAAMGHSADGRTEKSELIASVVSVAGGPRKLAAQWTSTSEEGPECVCGGALTRVGGAARAWRLVKSMKVPDHLAEAMFARVTHEGRFVSVVCDLCFEKNIPLDSALWTCSNEKETILHAAAYDVCEACFMQHAVDGGPVLPSLQQTEDS